MKPNGTSEIPPPNCTYEERLTYYSMSDLESIKHSLDRARFPDRYELLTQEIERRMKLSHQTNPPPLPGAPVQGNTTATTMSGLTMLSIVIGGLLGGIFAIKFFLHASALYAETPSDPQKPVGYVFIALYSGLIGAAAFGSVFAVFKAPTFRHNLAKLLGCAVVSLLLALAAVLLVRFSPK